MSQAHRAQETLEASNRWTFKFYKVIAWMLIVIGVLLMVTIIGFIPGLFAAGLGGGMLAFRKHAEAYMSTALAARAEEVEIHEHALRQARQAREQERQP